MDGLSLIELAKKAGVAPKTLLAWEYAGHFEARFRLKGKRHVRHFPPDMVERICRVAELVREGYTVSSAFRKAAAGMTS
jgi:hypothetical protein